MPAVSLQSVRVTALSSSGYPEGLCRVEYESPVDGQRDVFLMRPAAPGQSIWMVVIHGFGGRETQLYLRKDIKQAQLPCYLRNGYGIITPNLRGNAWMNPRATADMDAILDWIRERHASPRFIFSSGSLGATSNLMYGSFRPWNVSGIIARGAVGDLAAYYRYCRGIQDRIPFLGDVADSIEHAFGGTPAEQPERYALQSPQNHTDALASIPIALLHGVNDDYMPIAMPRQFVAAMGSSRLLTYRELTGASHEDPLGLPEEELLPSIMVAYPSSLRS